MSFHKNELLSDGASSSNGTTVVGLSMAQQLASERSFGASHVGGASFMKSYDCRFCGKQFSKMSKLTQHMKIHSNPEDHYKYPCDICGKKVKNIHFYPFLFNLAKIQWQQWHQLYPFCYFSLLVLNTSIDTSCYIPVNDRSNAISVKKHLAEKTGWNNSKKNNCYRRFYKDTVA